MPVTYEFGGFRLEVARRLLLGPDSLPISLTPKALDTLLHLIEHRGTVVSKEALFKAVWPDTVVEENNLNQNISVLRRVLGGSRNEHRYIVTISGRGYSFVAPVNAFGSLAASGDAPKRKTLAVLPFRPLVESDGDPSLELGMADTLIARLSAIHELVVRPISSVRNYARPGRDPLLAGQELAVDSILEGSLQKHGSKVRVTARLLNISSGTATWSGTFDEAFTDVFALQDSIAEKVVKALELRLSSTDKTRLTKHHTVNTEAYELYLKGRYYWWNTDPQEFNKSREYFHRAVEADPEYALGYCGLNSFYGFSSAWGLIEPNGWIKAEWAARKALELDDTLAEAHLGVAAAKMIRRDWSGAEDAVDKGIKLNPNFAEIHYFHSFLLMVMGKFESAANAVRIALGCDPFSVRINLQLANVFYYAGQFETALDQALQTNELKSHDASVHEFLGNVCWQLGKTREAIGEWLQASRLAGDTTAADVINSSADRTGEETVRRLAKMRLEHLNSKREKGEYVPSAHFARNYMSLGDKIQTLNFLEKASDEQNVYSFLILRDPQYLSLRKHPRFVQLLERFKQSLNY
jgi:serine/threonine-protein kinase